MHTTYNEYIKAYIKGQMNYKGVGSLSFPHCYCAGPHSNLHCRTQSSVILVLIFILFYPSFFYEVGKK
ncbi:hypothetical protein Peur_074136 [Populus x canadensis]